MLVKESQRSGALAAPPQWLPATRSGGAKASVVTAGGGTAHWHPVFGWFAHKLSEPYVWSALH